MGKAAWGHTAEPGNQWSHGSGWKLGFIAFFYCQGKRCLSGTDISWGGEVSPWLIITFSEHMDLLQSALHVHQNSHVILCRNRKINPKIQMKTLNSKSSPKQKEKC
jgi:hypothetical protein